MKDIEKLTEDIYKTRNDLLSWAMGFNKPGVSWWDVNKWSFLFFGFFLFLSLLSYFLGWIFISRILFILLGLMSLNILFKLIKKVWSLIWKRI